MSNLISINDSQLQELINAISSGGGGGGGSVTDITEELDGIKQAIKNMSNIVASNMHIQYITSGTLDANTTTTIHCTFERQYTQVPKVLATISPVQTNFPSAYVYITSITNITLTGCDINIVRIGNSISLTENRKIIVAIEDTSIIQTSGGGNENIYDTEEKIIGTYFGQHLYRKCFTNLNLSLTSTLSWQGFQLSGNDNIETCISCKLFRISGNTLIEYKPIQVDYQNYNGNYLEVKGSGTSNDEVNINMVIVEYTKMTPNEVTQDRERSIIDEG